MKKETTIDDKIALRAFVMTDLFPFLLEVYIKEGKSENDLREDIKNAREFYKKLVSSAKRK